MQILLRRAALTALLCVWAAGAGCNQFSPSLYQRLQNEDPAVRIQAILRAGDAKDQKAVPYLVDRLTDSEADVRVFAIGALERITGRTMGYHHYDPARQRLEAVARWRKWLKERGDAGKGSK